MATDDWMQRANLELADELAEKWGEDDPVVVFLRRRVAGESGSFADAIKSAIRTRAN